MVEIKIEELLSKAFEPGGVTKDEYALLEREYGRALNGGKCPCGSGKTFIDCCKLSWNALVRGRNRSKQTEKKEIKQANRDGKQYRADQPKWIVKVGINPNGTPAVMPLKDTSDTTELKLAGLLLATYHSLMVEGMIANIQSGMRTVFKTVTDGPENQAGIVGR